MEVLNMKPYAIIYENFSPTNDQETLANMTLDTLLEHAPRSSNIRLNIYNHNSYFSAKYSSTIGFTTFKIEVTDKYFFKLIVKMKFQILEHILNIEMLKIS